MDYLEFKDMLLLRLREQLGPQITMELHHIMKNNAQGYEALIMYESGQTISPNINLQLYYAAYQKDGEIDSIVSDIIHLWTDSMNCLPDIDLSMDFEAVKEQIIYRLVSTQHNQELLETIPSVPFLDLSIIFYITSYRGEHEIGGIRISNELMEIWDVQLLDLLRLAQVNTPRLFPPKLQSLRNTMLDLLEDMPLDIRMLLEEDLTTADIGSTEPYIATNASKLNGATVLLYPGYLQKIAGYFKRDFYILPSSIHEVILITKGEDENFQDLRTMVMDVNQSCVSADEILSDKVYCYRYKENRMDLYDGDKIYNTSFSLQIS